MAPRPLTTLGVATALTISLATGTLLSATPDAQADSVSTASVTGSGTAFETVFEARAATAENRDRREQGPAAREDSGTGRQNGRPTYTNAVTNGYSIDFPDPAVIRGKDGYWYGYATGGPYDENDDRHSQYKIARSTDLTSWEEVGSVFDKDNRPDWATETTGFWAPDIRYLNGQYLLYFTVPDTTASEDGHDPAIGVATAPTPAGPWKPSDEPLIPARQLPDGGWDSTIDPALFTDEDGTHYLYWGGYGTGLYAVRLSEDGTRTVGEPTHVGAMRYEGPYVMKRDGYYYMFASSANCCAGPTTGYAVFAGRSKSPLGPFVDKNGDPLTASRAGGTPVLAQNGNRWIGAGHHSAITDLAGQTWMAYHAIERDDPWLDVQPGFTMRGMNIDRLDWIDGWPVVRAGAGPSDGPQAAPVTRGELDERFERPGRPALRPVAGELDRVEGDPHSGQYGRLVGSDRQTAEVDALALSRKALSHSDVRVEADVRTSEADTGTVGVTARQSGPATGIRAMLDVERSELRIEARTGHRVRTEVTPLPENYDTTSWHTLALQARGDTATADVTDARTSDPWAEVSIDLPRGLTDTGRAGVFADGAAAEVDNVSAHPLFEPVTEAVPPPEAGAMDPAYSDEFDGDLSDWQWIREDPAAKLADGALSWPTQRGDIVGEAGGGTGVLLRDPPEGEYTVETKLSLDIGEDVNRNFQQAGLIVYAGDDEFLRNDVVAVGNTRIVEFGKETVFEDRLQWGAGLVGVPAETTWLRLHHELDPDTGEHLFRAASSQDGETWTYAGVWTLPADADPRIGLVSQGSSAEVEAEHGKATAEFDYVRFSRPSVMIMVP